MVATHSCGCNSKQFHSFGSSLVLLCVTVMLTMSASAADPQKPASQSLTAKPQTLSGKFVEIEKKGRIMLLKLTDKEGAEQQVLVNERTNFQLKAPGKPEMLQRGQIVTLPITQSDLGDLTAEKLTIHWGGNAPIRVHKNPMDPTRFEATGRLENIEGNTLMLYFGVEGGSRPVVVKDKPDIEIVTNDPVALKPQIPLEIEIHQAKGQKLPTAIAISATVDESFWTSEEGLAVAKKKKSGTTSKDSTSAAPKQATTKTPAKPTTPKTSKTTTKTPPPDNKDPFGVLNKK